MSTITKPVSSVHPYDTSTTAATRERLRVAENTLRGMRKAGDPAARRRSRLVSVAITVVAALAFAVGTISRAGLWGNPLPMGLAAAGVMVAAGVVSFVAEQKPVPVEQIAAQEARVEELRAQLQAELADLGVTDDSDI
ncbi:hypothetical protein ACWGJ9_09245 [Curtobacterium citreum]